MKTLSRSVLPLLLFVFGLFVVHDYIIDATDPDTQYELCYAEHGDMHLDTLSQLHAHIHILLDVPLPEQQSVTVSLHHIHPDTVIAVLHSRALSVPLRPPLS